jgi:hypothetical protein
MTFYNAEVAMILTVLLPLCAPQKHPIRTMTENPSSRNFSRGVKKEGRKVEAADAGPAMITHLRI